MFGRKYYWYTPPLDIIGGGLPQVTPSITLHAPPQAARTVTLRQTIATQHWSAHRTPTSAALGIDEQGIPVYIDIAKMPQLLLKVYMQLYFFPVASWTGLVQIA